MNIQKILLVSVFFPPSVGGPATFVSNIGPEFLKIGYKVGYVNLEPYKKASKLKQRLFFLRDLWKRMRDVDLVVICDTWSVLIPTVFMCLVRRQKYVVRIGGDFLWETYISRTKEHKKLSLFYTPTLELVFKEKIIYFLTCFALIHAQAIIFNTAWQRDIWRRPYNLEKQKTFIVENALVTGLAKYTWNSSMQRIMRCPVRASEFKNILGLKKVWDSISKNYPDTTLSFDYVHPEERSKILSETYCVIQPSISDVAPNLMCEAIANGCPCICTEDTGLKTLVPDDIGIYIDTKNESVIQEAFEKILDVDFHNKQVQKIADFKVTRTYSVLAEEYRDIWKML